MMCTDLDGEDGSISDQKRFDLEGLAEGSSLVHGTHCCCLICVNVLSQLLSEIGGGKGRKQTLQLQVVNFLSK